MLGAINLVANLTYPVQDKILIETQTLSENATHSLETPVLSAKSIKKRLEFAYLDKINTLNLQC